jgi:hypothetical protein
MSISLEISTNVTDLTVESDVTVIEISSAFPTVSASSIVFEAYNTLTATNIQEALEQLADQDFRSTTTPTGSNIEEGDTWYDTDDNQLKVYRETSAGVFEWVPIIIGNISPDSDTLDAGAF